MDVCAPAPAVETATPCIARQPILTSDQKVVGYELFFREGREQDHFTSDAEVATSKTLDALNTIGLDVLCDGQPAFINCTRPMLLTEYFTLLPPRDIVVEIQETVPADDEVRAACERLKKGGYSIALDNFVPDDPRESLAPYADFIKVDITRVAAEDWARLITLYADKGSVLVAHKVETQKAFLAAKKIGFTRFQGYFFHRPQSLQARQIPANQISYVRLLSAISKPEVNFDELEELIKHEPSLCYRLLRYLNSPLLGLKEPVRSVSHALKLLGERDSVRWIRLAITMVVGQEKSSDLVLSSLVRARFCELIAPRVERGKSNLFLMGMLSLMDVMLSVPMGMLIEELCLDADIKAQLLSAKTSNKTPLSPVYDLMVAREAGDWERVTHLAKQLKLSLSFVAETSNESMRWAHQITHAVEGPRHS